MEETCQGRKSIIDTSKSLCSWTNITFSSTLDADDDIGRICVFAEPEFSYAVSFINNTPGVLSSFVHK